jgi:predicted ribosomally synthesized peptide with nif11-like leader
MSREAFVKFYEDVVRNDEVLLGQLNATKTEQELTKLAVAKGKAAGFEFNDQDVLDILKAARAKRVQTPLSDDQLEAVSGGSLNFSTVYSSELKYVGSDLLSFNFAKI